MDVHCNIWSLQVLCGTYYMPVMCGKTQRTKKHLDEFHMGSHTSRDFAMMVHYHI